MTPVVAILAVDWLALVVGFNVVAVLLWFLLGALKRGHHTSILRVKITIEEIRQSYADDEDLTRGLDEVLGHLQEAEDAGPLRGRGALSAAHGAMAALVARAQEEVDEQDVAGWDSDK